MRKYLPALFVLSTLLGVSFQPAHAAQDIVSGVSTDLIEIRSDFTGTEVVVFGALEGTDPATAIQDYDVVVVLRGPEVELTVRRKERILGIWINRAQFSFGEMPGYYFLGSTGPIEDIAPPQLLRRFQLGAEILGETLDDNIGDEDEIAFRTAAVRNMAREQLFIETPDGIEFLSQTLFAPAFRFRPQFRLANITLKSISSAPVRFLRCSLRPFLSTRRGWNGASLNSPILLRWPMAYLPCCYPARLGGSVTCFSGHVSKHASAKRWNAGLCPPQYQCMDIVGPFIGADRLKIQHMANNAISIRNPICAMHFTSSPSNL